MASSALKEKDPNTLSALVYAAKESVTVYKAASVSSQSLRVLRYGTAMTAVAKSGDSAWYRVKVDGTEKITHSGPNPFFYNPDVVNYYFGFYSTTSDGSWYVVKSADITVNAE